METLKLLVVGGSSSRRARFVTLLSEVKIKPPSAPRGDRIPMEFGRMHLEDGHNIQVFGAGHDWIDDVLETLTPGVGGAILLVSTSDLEHPGPARLALSQLAVKGVTAVSARIDDASSESICDVFGFPPEKVVDCSVLDRASAKAAVLALLESLLGLPGGAAA